MSQTEPDHPCFAIGRSMSAVLEQPNSHKLARQEAPTHPGALKLSITSKQHLQDPKRALIPVLRRWVALPNLL